MTRAAEPKKKLTYADYLLFPDDGKRHELIDGEHYVSPSPNLYHQTVSGRIFAQLFFQIEAKRLGRVLAAPMDVQLSLTSVVEPDLIVVLERNRHILAPKRIKGAPDLLVEILSDSTAKQDFEDKPKLYAASGVPEYWIVSPDEHTVEQHLLEGSAYRLAGTHETEITFCGLEGVVVDLKKVW